MVNLLNYNREQLREFFTELGEKPFRADQILQWVHQYGVTDFAKMTNLSTALRAKLTEIAEVRLPEVALHQQSTDGTEKWLLRLEDGQCIETVFIPENGRGTLCVSSQVGCVVNCSFCATGKQGFSRDLTTAEIIAQVWLAVRTLSTEEGRHDHHVTNVVMMGMGEPLLNFDAVVAAMDLMLDDLAYGLSKYRVTLSTSGLIPAMKKLSARSPVALAVSLHAPTDVLRNELVPINRKYPLADLMAVCRDYFKDEPRRHITFEYVMLKDVNDQPQHAKALVKLLEGVPAKMNLIPFNPIPNAPYQRPSRNAIDRFRDILVENGLNTITRKTRGDDIDGACGQLVGKVADRTRRAERQTA